MGQGTQEWNKRIELWMEELKNQFYEVLEPVEFEGFTTSDALTFDEAMKHSFHPMPVGTKWGRKWEYGWFRTKVRIKEEAEGRRIYLVPGIGGEMLVWVNGKVSCSVDLEHSKILLTTCAKSGEVFEIGMESYAGHGPRLENGGPYPPERIPIPEPPEFQVVVRESHYGSWEETAYGLWLDVFTLYQLWQSLDPKSLRSQKIREGLLEFSKIVDYELPRQERIKTYAVARSVLAPLLACTNGSTMPEYTIFGQSHLDLAWKWPWAETRRKCGRTISTQLALCEEYPEYQFLICQPVILKSIKKDYPELYDRLKERVRKGQFLPEGGLWVEPDTNIPSGESLIRHCLWGKRWFNEEYGYDTKMVWMPDTFGFSGQLPQIFKGAGMHYFASQKIARALRGHDPFPYNIFHWEGIDGTRILTHFFIKNNSRYDPSLLIGRWNNDRVQQENIDTFLFPFGFGDGGGGPTRDMLEVVGRTKDLEGVPRTRMQRPVSFFAELEKRNNIINNYVGEIYLAWHRGSYTAQAKTKKGNRLAEIALHELEFWGSLTGIYDREQIEGLWEKLLFNQFHDILAGTSIARVHQEAEEDFLEVIGKAGKLTKEVLQGIVRPSEKEQEELEGITVFNSLSWDREVIVRLPEGARGALDYRRQPLPVQSREDFCDALVLVPACGYTTIYPCQGVHLVFDQETEASNNPDSKAALYQETQTGVYGVRVTKSSMENDLLRITFDDFGQIISIYDKVAEIEFAEGIANRMCMYQDINIDYDAWELAHYYDELPISLDGPADIEVVSEGLISGSLRITRRLHNSNMIQEIRMTRGSRRVDFWTCIDWQETHKLLKVAFPVQVYTQEAIEEIQFGYVKRPTHKSRTYDGDRFEVCNHRYTALSESNRCFALLNDSKYGISTKGNVLMLSLLRAPVIPDMHADQGLQEFTYSIYADSCSFLDSNIVQQGYELNYPVLVAAGKVGERSYFKLSSTDIILETVKLAEDGSDDMILRLYEAKGGHVTCNLVSLVPFDLATEVDLQEKCIEEGVVTCIQNTSSGKLLRLSFRPFEIKTLRLMQS